MCGGLWMKIILDDCKEKYEKQTMRVFSKTVQQLELSIIQFNRTEQNTERLTNFIQEKLDSGGLLATTDVLMRLQLVKVFTKVLLIA